MTEEIDYKALYEQVQSELEAARIAILNMRSTPGFKIDLDSMKSFVEENYLVLIIAFLLLSFIVSSLKMLKELFKP